MSDNTNLNTIKLKVNEMVNLIGGYIVNTNREQMKGLKLNSFMLWGPPGVGKSASLIGIKNKVQNETGKKLVITDVRLLLFNPVDLRGIPVPDANKELAIWLKPKIFQMDPSPDIINILMLDEISAAPPSVQAAAYQITLDRQVGEHKLPDNCYIICAGNRLQDKSVAYKMPKALANRLTHFDIESELDDWKSWAISVGNIDPSIVGYLNFAPGNLYAFKPDSDDNSFPTPRTWEMANNYLKVFGNISNENSFNCVAGCLGLSVASEYKRYCQVYTKIPNIDDILEGKYKDCPKDDSSVITAISAGITSRIAAKLKSTDTKNQLTNAHIANVLKYTEEMPREYAVLTVKDMLYIDGIKSRLLQVKEWVAWAGKNKSFII